MTHAHERLIYVMGPSGAGKDSVLDWLRQTMAATPGSGPLHWARRTITRPPSALAEQHESVSLAQFRQLSAAGAFALHWDANHTCYGIRQQALAPLAAGGWVLVNGSRAHCPQALAQFPGMKLVHITASAAVLRARLLARGRESPRLVQERLRRNDRMPLPPCHLEIVNDGALADAGQLLLRWLRGQPGWTDAAPDPGAARF